MAKKPSEETVIALMGKDITNIQKDIAKMSGTLENLSSAYVTSADFKDHIKTDEDHETRIRVLESSMWKWVGIASVGAAVLSTGIAVALKFL